MHPVHTPAVPHIELPAIACTLDATGLADRFEEFQSLFIAALRSHVRVPAQLWLALSVTPEEEPDVRDLFAREAACCQFFSFTFQRDGEILSVSMNVPDDDIPMLDEFENLARRAETAASR
ncbi:MAG: hypothetical protein M3069_13430 [Chloroflexota bacterium]|nr:hypothetical protein [Chloroflexota bacterium]